MNRNIFMLAFIFILISCKPTLNRKAQVDLKGNWMISNVSYIGSDVLKINSFNIADSKCFEGSQWKFVSNNNSGTMTVSKVGCPGFSSPIVWTITSNGDFTLKITEGEKAKRVTQGYFLKIKNQSETAFQLVDNVTIGGKNTEVIYQFIKQ